ncbi:hypothetical protein BGX30_002259 [Mortierella sp. GBA39]|nr:hypothetical protein BGX30_002259 [Mortierella sp. GBA39]
MSATMKSGALAPLNNGIKKVEAPANSIPDTFGISVWPFIALLAVITIVMVIRTLRKPKVAIPAMKPKRAGLSHLLFEKRWHPFFTAILVGLIALLAWPLSEATGRMSGLGITTPSANILQYLVTGDSDKYVNWGMFLVLGILVGSFIAARGSREFRFRAPDAKTAVSSFAGGILMGFGASWAGGCSIGNGLVMTAMMTWQGWVSLVFMILGTWTASYFVHILKEVTSMKQQKLAVLGMVCPFPLIEAKQAIEELNSGDELVIDFDCTQATEAIPRWAAEAGHTVTNFEQIDDASWTITVQKR